MEFCEQHQIVSLSFLTLFIASLYTFKTINKLYRKSKQKDKASQSTTHIQIFQHNQPPKFLRMQICCESPKWYQDYKEKAECNEFGKKRYPRDQILQYINRETLSGQNMVKWLPEWYKEYLMDIEKPYYIGSVPWRPKYNVCLGCKQNHCKHNLLPIDKPLECCFCFSFHCIHFNRNMDRQNVELEIRPHTDYEYFRDEVDEIIKL